VFSEAELALLRGHLLRRDIARNRTKMFHVKRLGKIDAAANLHPQGVAR
jgi:hypothetical protein